MNPRAFLPHQTRMIVLGLSLASAALASLWLGRVAAAPPPDAAAPNAAAPNAARHQDFLRFYQYDANLPLDPAVTPRQGTEDYILEQIVFSSAHDERVPAYLALPKQAKGPVPAIVYLHGHTGSKEGALEAAGILARSGRAMIAIDAQYHGDRQREGIDIYSDQFYRMRDALVQTVIDNRRAIDYLQTRPEIDHERIGIIGGSMGGILGAILAGVEQRVKATVLIVGGGDWECLARLSQQKEAKQIRAEQPDLSFERVGDILAPADPIFFAAHISPRPLLMQNGRLDETVPASCAERLYDAARDPKRIDWYESGHSLPLEKMVPKVLAWLDDNL